MDKRIMAGIIILIIIIVAIYLILGSSTPENITQSPALNKSNVSGLFT